jgi:hypothetical protein
MAEQITSPEITAALQEEITRTGGFDLDNLISRVNAVLPAGKQIGTNIGVTTGVYKRFGDFDKVNAKVEVVTTGLWTNDSASLTSFFTSSAQSQTAVGKYYFNVFDVNPTSSDSEEVQFAVAYGHVYASGSATLDIDPDSLLETKGTYAQYKSMLLEPTDNFFSFDNSSGIAVDSNDIYVINVARARYREQMDAGNWSLKLQGSNGLFTFIDDSGKKFGDTLGKAGRVFKIVSGSLNLGTQNDATVYSETAANGLGYGLFYPDRGILVINPAAIANTVGSISTQTVYTNNGLFVISGSLAGNLGTDKAQYNHARLYSVIKAGADFDARRTENISTQHFFVRATNREFNYSNNPTYVNADGTFSEITFNTDPQTFITTVGLMNDSNELIAVAKTSQPIVKSFDREVLIKVKLSF